MKITIFGKLLDGRPFEGSDTIKVISLGKTASLLLMAFLACFGAGGLFARQRKSNFL